MPQVKDTFIGVWVTPDLARQIKEVAAREGRTVSNLVRRTLTKALEVETSTTSEEVTPT